MPVRVRCSSRSSRFCLWAKTLTHQKSGEDPCHGLMKPNKNCLPNYGEVFCCCCEAAFARRKRRKAAGGSAKTALPPDPLGARLHSGAALVAEDCLNCPRCGRNPLQSRRIVPFEISMQPRNGWLFYSLTVSPALMHTVLPSTSAQTSVQVGLWRVRPSALARMLRQALT